MCDCLNWHHAFSKVFGLTIVNCRRLVCNVLGVLCEVDINECNSNPCPSESVCFNFDGGYACNCSDPALCPSLYSEVITSAWGVSWEEIAAIAGQSH